MHSFLKGLRLYTSAGIFGLGCGVLLFLLLLTFEPSFYAFFIARPFLILVLFISSILSGLISYTPFFLLAKWRRQRTEKHLRMLISIGVKGTPVQIEEVKHPSVFKINGLPSRRRAVDEKGKIYFISSYSDTRAESFEALIYTLPRGIPLIDYYAFVPVEKATDRV